MKKKSTMRLYKELETNLTDKQFLKNMKMTKKVMLIKLEGARLSEKVEKLIGQGDITCTSILDICSEILDGLCDRPQVGWLQYIYESTIDVLFPINEDNKSCDPYFQGRYFYLETLRTCLDYQRENRKFLPLIDLELLKDDEIQDCSAREEYFQFRTFMRDNYVIEFMKIGKEITSFNTIGHISGVHYGAVHIGRQLVKVGAPVDIALVSGAAAGHDLGKYGCRGSSANRIPYLHYYYTDQVLRRNNMPLIAHIASNHSTWDLEIENLSVEALVLIYADFRVKSQRINGEELIHFYTLEESFNIILNKLDNVDDAKRKRYERVYAKLKDFEEYMVSLGVSTDFNVKEMSIPAQTDSALLRGQEVVDKLKHLAIEHNIDVMNQFNSEAAFGNLLEAARSEKQWKNVRAYINVLREYYTYMTAKQTMMTLHFLYDLLMHKEGDIRRQSADLIGEIIVNYDEEYKKELPEGVQQTKEDMDSFQLWDFYLKRIIYPDHKVTDQHRGWIGFCLKLVLISAQKNCRTSDEKEYLSRFLTFFKGKDMEDETVFILLDSLLSVSLKTCTQKERQELLEFSAEAVKRDSLEIKISGLRFASYMVENYETKRLDKWALIVMDRVEDEAAVSVIFLKLKIKNRLGIIDEKTAEYEDRLYNQEQTTSDIFLENLKLDTSWIIKAANIDVLLDGVESGRVREVLHVATHLSNLIKVSERITVRHSAGKGLISVIKRLPLDQRNELVIELTKGLEIGEYQFSKYIPAYLGEVALYLHPNELNELIKEFGILLESTNERVVSVTLDTLGELMSRYAKYKDYFSELEEDYDRRRQMILGMLLRGLANYNDIVSEEAFRVIGQYIFGSHSLSLEEKNQIFQRIYKKMLTLIVDQKEDELMFFTNAAALNHIYRFISEYNLTKGQLKLPMCDKIAFFPGTFDPFSSSHKGIITSIRDLGFEVYLALDEFSWSKKTQPRMIRRKIITMSVADEGNVYVFPDNIPVNISNSDDLKNLKGILPEKDLYIVVGSDVIVNASAYKVPPEENSIHTLNHIVFRRESIEAGDGTSKDLTQAYKAITGNIVELTLPVHLEDISSTRIRENIDYNRDISNLIDPVAQNYIYDNSLYLRESQYKLIMQAKAIHFDQLEHRGSDVTGEMTWKNLKDNCEIPALKKYLDDKNVRSISLRNGNEDNKLEALAAFKHVATSHLYEEFKNQELAAYIRKKTTGKIMVIGGIYFNYHTSIRDIVQLIITEILAQGLKEDFTYAIYNPIGDGGIDIEIYKTLKRQGFEEILIEGNKTGIYEVDMKSPISLSQNMDTVLKDPFNKSEKVVGALEGAHENMQMALTQLYPGNLVLSFNSGVVHHKLVDMITRANNVSSEPAKVRKLGEDMCVPFGKILRGMAVPNTVTKTLHTEKYFNPHLDGFTIEEYPFYSPINNQVKIIKSFKRKVILVDDLLHKGYRIKKLDPILKENNIEVKELMVGLLSGQGKDLMTIQGREVKSAYFIPNLANWFVESSLYPFIGGDAVKREDDVPATLLPSINLVLPYAAPRFLKGAPKEAIYNFSMVCLENARNIFLALEEEYQNIFERQLTLKRLSEVVISPRIPDGGNYMNYDMNLAPSTYLTNAIEHMIRLEDIIL
ncbi:MAG: hypothetical protein RSD88_04510 [Anaerovoracaceae bacterium]